MGDEPVRRLIEGQPVLIVVDRAMEYLQMGARRNSSEVHAAFEALTEINDLWNATSRDDRRC